MKNLKIRPLGGLYFALLFIFNITLVTIAVVKNDDLYVAYAILLSCSQFYIYQKCRMWRIFFAYDCHDDTPEYHCGDEKEKFDRYYQINPN